MTNSWRTCARLGDFWSQALCALSVVRNGNTIHCVGCAPKPRSPAASPARQPPIRPVGRISSVLSVENGEVLAGRASPVIERATRRKQIGEPDRNSWTYDCNTRGEKRSPAGNLLDGHGFTYQYDAIGNRNTASYDDSICFGRPSRRARKNDAKRL